jgi:hypothetical protein
MILKAGWKYSIMATGVPYAFPKMMITTLQAPETFPRLYAVNWDTPVAIQWTDFNRALSGLPRFGWMISAVLAMKRN